jgi:hypothetical protein
MKAYKPLYLEAKKEVEKLQGELDRLRELMRLSPDDAHYELDRRRVVVDLSGIARHMRVERYTPQQWRQRGHLPPVDFPDIKEPLWYASTIKEKFAIPSQRIWYDDAEDGDWPDEGDEELSPAA